MRVERNRHIALQDGVRLHADVYRPDAGGPFPALVGWSAFGKEVQAVGLERKPLRLGQCLDDLSIEIGGIDFWTEHGYAVVLVNPRGISTSEGTWRGLYSEQDQRDCYACIEWAAWQDWCTGSVGMLGCGTAGRIQPLVAALQPPHLKAIMPIDLVDDLYAECYPGGILSNYYLPFTSTIPMIDAISDAECEMSREELLAALKRGLEKPEIQEDPYLYRTLDTVPPRHFPWLVDILLHDRRGPFWEKRGQKGKNGDIKIPMYAVSLCYEFGRSSLAAIHAFTDPACSAPRKLMLMGHPCDRETPFVAANGEMLRWYDWWLKGIDTGIMAEPPVRLYVMGENRFRQEPGWPPVGMTYQKLYLRGNGALSFEQESTPDAPDRLYHEPPIYKSQFSGQLPALTYTTAPLAADMELTGPVELTIYSAIDQDDGNFIAKLWDVAPDGKRVMLSNGELRAACRALLPESVPGEPEHDLDHPQPVTPGQVYAFTVGLKPVCNVFRAGHALQLEIKATDAQGFSFRDTVTIPRLFSSGLTSGALPSTRFTNYRVYHDDVHPSHLLIPVVPRAPKQQWVDR